MKRVELDPDLLCFTKSQLQMDQEPQCKTSNVEIRAKSRKSISRYRHRAWTDVSVVKIPGRVPSRGPGFSSSTYMETHNIFVTTVPRDLPTSNTSSGKYVEHICTCRQRTYTC